MAIRIEWTKGEVGSILIEESGRFEIFENLRIDSGSESSFENSPNRFVIGSAYARDRIINEALDTGISVGRAGALVADAANIAARVSFALEENAISISGCALFAAGIKILSAGIIFVSGWKSDGSFFEAAKNCALVQDRT